MKEYSFPAFFDSIPAGVVKQRNFRHNSSQIKKKKHPPSLPMKDVR